MNWLTHILDLLPQHRGKAKKKNLLPASDDPAIFYLDKAYAEGRSNLKTESVVEITPFSLGCGLLLVLMMLPFLMILRHNVWENSQIVAHGQQIEAEVMGCRRERSGHWLTYKYTVMDSSGIQHEYVDSEGAPQCLPAGALVTILYVPDDPEVSHPVERSTGRADAGIALMLVCASGVFILITVGCGLQIIGYIRGMRRYRRLIAEGILLPGKFMDGVWDKSSNSAQLTVQYEFNTPDGEILRRKQTTSRYKPDFAPLPPAGTPVRIVYADDRTHVML